LYGDSCCPNSGEIPSLHVGPEGCLKSQSCAVLLAQFKILFARHSPSPYRLDHNRSGSGTQKFPAATHHAPLTLSNKMHKFKKCAGGALFELVHFVGARRLFPAYFYNF